MILRALGTDLEDGPLSAQSFAWTSDKDGSLGGGAQVMIDRLSVGEHTLTLNGVDAQGNTGSYSVKIVVEPPSESITETPLAPTTPPSATTGSNAIVWIGLIVVAMALVVLAVIGLLLRKR